jgi:hypothetical protein
MTKTTTKTAMTMAACPWKRELPGGGERAAAAAASISRLVAVEVVAVVQA